MMRGMLTPVEDETYFFDAAAAEKPVKFFETYLKHFEGRHAGKPFLLADPQKRIIRDLFGWKERSTGFRRFTQCWIEAAAGAGKSPLLAGIGLYGLMADGEEGAQVYSVASNFSQARVVFDCAKQFIEQEQALAARLKVTQYQISHRRSRSFWRIISGKGPKAGLRPSVVLGDEIHEWPTREVYDSLQGRMTKRTQPLFVLATNAGESRESLCWALHEEAVAVLADPAVNPKMYPVIWESERSAAIDDPEAWKDANPLLGVTIAPIKVREECERAKGSPALEARFRRLYMTQWVQGINKWLNLPRWDACTHTAGGGPATPPDAALYIGVDLSLGDDLCAALYVSVAADLFQVEADFWMPRSTAEEYARANAIPYPAWAAAGHITLTDGQTIGTAERAIIAARIRERAKGRKVKAVCYDRYKADEVIAALEAAGLVCVPIAQGFTVYPGCAELDRRLKDSTIRLADNPVLRMCAENVQVKTDARGNYWPVKPKAKGRYAGRRAAKIDGISALVTALTEARKHSFPKASQQFRGGAWSI